MEPIKVRLSVFEIHAVKNIMESAARKCTDRRRATTEDIILAENYLIWWNRLQKFHIASAPNKEKTYGFAISLARVLHTRLQEIDSTVARQSILAKLDYALTNADWKPIQTFKLS